MRRHVTINSIKFVWKYTLWTQIIRLFLILKWIEYWTHLLAYTDAFVIIFYSYTVNYRRGEQNYGNTNKLRNRICFGYIERTSVGSTECSPTVCLHSVSALVIVLSDSPCERIGNGRHVRFWKMADCCFAFNWSICGKPSTLLGVSRATVSKVMSAYTNHGKTSSAKWNSGWKSILTERDRRTLRRFRKNTELL
jgi:hypothetical protein